MCEIKLIISFLSKHDGFCLSDLAIEWKCILDKKKLTPVTLLVLIHFCSVLSELFNCSSVTKTCAILPANIIEYQV